MAEVTSDSQSFRATLESLRGNAAIRSSKKPGETLQKLRVATICYLRFTWSLRVSLLSVGAVYDRAYFVD